MILHDRLIPAARSPARGPTPSSSTSASRAAGSRCRRRRSHRLLLEHARAGRRVVRLKGGDPFVFGRGGEEALALPRGRHPASRWCRGSPPGVAAPAYAGHPGHAPRARLRRRVRDRHEDPEKPDSALDWPALAAFPGTLVFYMGVRALPRIAGQLIAGGRPADEPAAVVERGTLPGQRTLLATLAEVAGARRRRRSGRPRSRSSGPVAGLARAARVARAAAAARAHDRGHARARRRPARWPRGCASWAPPSSRRRRSGSGRSRPSCPTSGATTWSA